MSLVQVFCEASQVKRQQASWIEGLSQLSPEELWDIVPVSYPLAHKVLHQATGIPLPGVSRFPLESWLKDGMPTLDTTAWCLLAIKVARKDPINLSNILVQARAKLQELKEEKERAAAQELRIMELEGSDLD